MKKIGIFYGSTTGTTQEVASRIARKLGVADADVHDVAKSAPSDVAPYDVLLMGTSTWGAGDMQEDWYDFTDGLQALTLKDKEFGIFGCGDETMTDTFCSGMGELYGRVAATGARHIGNFNADGYSFHESGAEVDGRVIGLVLDQVNHPDMTDARIEQWTDLIKGEM